VSEPILTIIARNLRKRRRAIGLSQEELANRAGLHRTYVSAVERGERNLTVGSLEKLAVALECKFIEFVTPR
jgi:transcriptional regulator with XRE-family HTH domain